MLLCIAPHVLTDALTHAMRKCWWSRQQWDVWCATWLNHGHSRRNTTHRLHLSDFGWPRACRSNNAAVIERITHFTCVTVNPGR
jgi:hypothetical protein